MFAFLFFSYFFYCMERRFFVTSSYIGPYCVKTRLVNNRYLPASCVLAANLVTSTQLFIHKVDRERMAHLVIFVLANLVFSFRFPNHRGGLFVLSQFFCASLPQPPCPSRLPAPKQRHPRNQHKSRRQRSRP